MQPPTAPGKLVVSRKSSQCLNYSYNLSSDNVGVNGYKMYIRIDGKGEYTYTTGMAGNDYWGGASSVTSSTCDSRYNGHSVELYLTATDANNNESVPSNIAKVGIL